MSVSSVPSSPPCFSDPSSLSPSPPLLSYHNRSALGLHPRALPALLAQVAVALSLGHSAPPPAIEPRPRQSAPRRSALSAVACRLACVVLPSLPSSSSANSAVGVGHSVSLSGTPESPLPKTFIGFLVRNSRRQDHELKNARLVAKTLKDGCFWD